LKSADDFEGVEGESSREHHADKQKHSFVDERNDLHEEEEQEESGARRRRRRRSQEEEAGVRR